MKFTFIIPPMINGGNPAERTSGCTRVVYNTPNIYELTVAASLEALQSSVVEYKDFVYNKTLPEQFEEFIKTDDSDVYLIWSVNLSIDNDVKVSQLIHQYKPSAYVIFEGPGPTFFIEKCLCSPLNIVVRGEPDLTVTELANKLITNEPWTEVEGISYKIDGITKNNSTRPLIKSLDTLPFPARHFIEDKVWRNPKLKRTPYTVIISSRNCPYKCIYCVPSSLTFAREIESRRICGKKPVISYRSPESIDKELKMLHDQGYKSIGFMDDNFIWNEKRTLLLCHSLKKYGFKWGCQARVDAITENIAKALGESGCSYVDLGVESFNDDILKFIKKGITQAQIYNAIGLLKQHKVPVKLNILIGTSPLETKETIKDTLRRAKALKVDQIMFNIVSPFPGTEFYELAKQNGWITTGEYVPTDVQRESILSYPHLNSKEMESILFKSNLSYFLSPYFVMSQISRFRSFKEFWYALKILKVKLFG